MQLGINYAWKNYGWDFGLPPKKDSGRPWGERAAWQPEIEERLAHFRDLGLFAVRWFLLGDGTTYGMDGEQPQPDPSRPGGFGFADCPPLRPEFLADFEQLLIVCERAGIQLLPSLCDFHLAFPGVAVPGSSGIVKGGRSEIFTDPDRRQQFFAQVLKPLLTLAVRYRPVIYAFELINEPEWCAQRPGVAADRSDPKRTVPVADLRRFIRDGATLINDAGLLSTVGFALHSTLEEWDSPGLGLTLHQFHYYAEPAPIPPHRFDPRWPAIIGEIPTAFHRPWPELGATQTLEARLRHIESLGYPATFLWSANRDEEQSADPAAVDFSPELCARLRSFCRR